MHWTICRHKDAHSLRDSLTEEAIAEFKNHWGQQLLASILFSFKAGAANQSSVEQAVNLVVVKNRECLGKQSAIRCLCQR